MTRFSRVRENEIAGVARSEIKLALSELALLEQRSWEKDTLESHHHSRESGILLSTTRKKTFTALGLGIRTLQKA